MPSRSVSSPTRPPLFATILLAIVAVLSLALVSSTSSDEVKEHVAIDLTLQNELSEPVVVFYEDENGRRVAQGEPLAAGGGRVRLRTFPGHRFTYDFGGERHYVIVPDVVATDGAPATFVHRTLLAGRHEIGVRCRVSVGGSSSSSSPEEDDVLVVRVVPWWSERGAARFLSLVRAGHYDGVALHRAVPRFLTQFGIPADHDARTRLRTDPISDDTPPEDGPVPFRPGIMSFAGSGPSSRTTEVFVVMPNASPEQLAHFGTNVWETPFGIVDDVERSVAARWYAGYGDVPPWGNGPDPQKIYEKDGYEYLKAEFPKLDYIEKCSVVEIELQKHDEL